MRQPGAIVTLSFERLVRGPSAPQVWNIYQPLIMGDIVNLGGGGNVTSHTGTHPKPNPQNLNPKP